MPGIQIRPWKMKYVKTEKKDSIIDALADRIVLHLTQLPAEPP